MTNKIEKTNVLKTIFDDSFSFTISVVINPDSTKNNQKNLNIPSKMWKLILTLFSLRKYKICTMDISPNEMIAS